MKKRFYLLAILSLLMITSSKQTVLAVCDNTSKLGAVSVDIPKLATVGTYNIWTRMQAPDEAHNQYRLEINGQTCYEVGGSSITPNQWTWVSFQDGNLSSKVKFDFNEKSGNTAKLIGSQAGVKVDRLLLVKTDCVPIADGSNCQSSDVSSSAVDTSGATQIPSPSSGPVGGLIMPSTTITQNITSIQNVIYSVDGKQLPNSDGFVLDTTLLSNGSHQVAIQITKTNGLVINEATTINVENPENAFTPFRRWVRLNQSSAVWISSIVGGILLITAIFLIVRQIKLQRRLLEFKGF